MIELELTDGKKVWVNTLMIRNVVPHGIDGQVEVYFDANTRYTVKGDATVLAGQIHAILRAIHTPT